MKQVRISEVLSLLKQGYTRLEKDASEPGKSIQTYYELPGSKVSDIFKHPKLKFQTTDHHAFELIDDTEEEVIPEATVDADVAEAVNAILA